MRAFACLALLLLGSCAPAPSYVVHLDPGFTEAELFDAEAALDSWEAVLPVRLDSDVRACHGLADGVICVHASDREELLSLFPPDPSDVGLAWRVPGIRGGEVWVDVQTLESGAPELIRTTVAHEVGHTLGLDHLPAGNLMAPVLEFGLEEPTSGDFVAWYGMNSY